MVKTKTKREDKIMNFKITEVKRSKAELITEARRCRALSTRGQGQPKYSAELKRSCINAIDKGIFSSAKEFTDACGFSATITAAWRKELSGTISSRTVSHGKLGVRYSISTKIQAVEQVLTHGKSLNSVAIGVGATWQTVSNWIKDYQNGLYSLENVTQVSRKKFKTSDILIGELKEIESSIESKKEEVRTALRREFEEKLEAIA